MLTEIEFATAAQIVGCDVAAIKAVTEVEARGAGFNPDHSPKILFEGHWFYRFTKGKWANSHPTICYPTWTKKYYGKTYADENNRFAEAVALDPNAALMSASWGMFQIMGFNFAYAGYASVNEFVADMHTNEGKHLAAFCNYVNHAGLSDELQRHRWDDFARLYNGPEYKKNNYAIKLMQAWQKFGGK